MAGRRGDGTNATRPRCDQVDATHSRRAGPRSWRWRPIVVFPSFLRAGNVGVCGDPCPLLPFAATAPESGKMYA